MTAPPGVSCRVTAGLLVLTVALGVVVPPATMARERLQASAADLVSARRLIEEAQGRYGRLPIGPSSLELYSQYWERYGFADESFLDACIGLVASSLSLTADASAELLRAEFSRTLAFRNGLLGVYAPLAQKWGLDGSATPSAMDQTITDVDERLLFKTALLADTMATIWSFVLGYQYFRLYGEAPPQSPPDQSPLSQDDIDQRLRDLADEVGAGR